MRKRGYSKKLLRICRNSFFILVLSLCVFVGHTMQIVAALREVESESEVLTRPELPILDEFFPSHSLDSAWETYPLLSTFSRNVSACLSSTATSDGTCISSEIDSPATTISIATIYTQSSLEKRLRMFANIFDLKKMGALLGTITSDPESEHQRHYQVIKKVVESNGKQENERHGMLPGKKLDVPTIHKAMSEGHFSLNINNVQHWWGSVTNLSRSLQQETMCGYVSCNLYLTPPATIEERIKSGFEAHYDWMDVIVLQIEGRKVWSVASEPTTYLPNPDQNRYVNADQLQRYRETKYNDITLQPGDVLYIPRGFVHNASTTFIVADDDGDGPKSKNKPSLHLTFGIEHGCATTMEMLLHRAIDAFVQQNGMALAIHQSRCQSDQDISWDMVLHAAVMDIARTVRCERIPKSDNNIQGEKRSDPCELRKGIPFDPVWSHIASTQQRRRQGTKNNNGGMLLTSFWNH